MTTDRWGAGVAVAIAIAVTVVAPVARADDVAVTLVVEPGARHRDELSRELGAYRFRAVIVDPAQLAGFLGARGGLWLTAGSPGRLEAFVLDPVAGRRALAGWALPANEPLARRRALLAALEALRAELVLPPATTTPPGLGSAAQVQLGSGPAQPAAVPTEANNATDATSAAPLTTTGAPAPIAAEAPTAVVAARARPPATAAFPQPAPERWSLAVGAAVLVFRGDAGAAMLIEAAIRRAVSPRIDVSLTVAAPAWTTSPVGPEGRAIVRPFVALAGVRRTTELGARTVAHVGLGLGALAVSVEGQPNPGYVSDQMVQWSALARAELGIATRIVRDGWIGVAVGGDAIAPDVAVGFAGRTAARFKSPHARAALYAAFVF